MRPVFPSLEQSELARIYHSGENLRLYRELHGFTQQELGKRQGSFTRQNNVSKIDSLQILSGGFSVEGDFGTANIKGGEHDLEIHT